MTSKYPGTKVGPQVIVALDYPTAKPALDLVEQLDPAQCRLKIGKQLFTTEGPKLVTALQNRGFDLFLDLKFHDIPNTVAGACAAAVDLGVWMVNVHAAGGVRMLEAARKAVPVDRNSPTQLIAVTVLTSMTEADLAATGISQSLHQQVDGLALLARESGLDGVVCSAQEAARLRQLCGPEFSLVTPGVRPAGSDSADQRRVMTPLEAVASGSNFLVIGRPVTQAANPLQALQEINRQLSQSPTPLGTSAGPTPDAGCKA